MAYHDPKAGWVQLLGYCSLSKVLIYFISDLDALKENFSQIIDWCQGEGGFTCLRD